MKIQFEAGRWDENRLVYAYSRRFAETPVFLQETDCIRNAKNETFRQGYDNVSLLTPEPVKPGVTVVTHCSFEHYGAPLILLAEAPEADAQGRLWMERYIEVVLYENGINVWKMYPENGEVRWKKLMSVEFPLEAGKVHSLSVTTEADRLHIEAAGRKMSLYMPEMYPQFHAGICACEGVNRFYDLTIE